MNYNFSVWLFLALILLLLVTRCTAVETKTGSVNSRDLIGYHDMMQVHETSIRIPTMYPTAAAPTPYPVGDTMNYSELAPAPAFQRPITKPTKTVPIIRMPTKFPTFPPTPFPTRPQPTLPTEFPSTNSNKSTSPSPTPDRSISEVPSAFPSLAPTRAPSYVPSSRQSKVPSGTPSSAPSKQRSISPSDKPSEQPSNKPTFIVPSERPSISEEPSDKPSLGDTDEPSGTNEPSFEQSGTDEPNGTDESSGISSNFSDDLIGGRAEKDDLRPSSSPVLIPSKSPSPIPTSTSTSAFGQLSQTNSLTISDVICDAGNVDLWGILCSALKEVNLFQTLGATGTFTIFAPTNDAFASLGDYALNVLFQNPKELRNLMSVHIAPLALPYDALLCNLNTEMLNFDNTYTLCIGGIKFQAADGNEIRNLPVIGELEDLQTKNGIIHAVNNLIIPFEFSINDIIKESRHDTVINERNSTEGNRDNTSGTPSTIHDENATGKSYNVSDILIDDVVENNHSTSPLSTSLNNVAEGIANRTITVDDSLSCIVCENIELCAFPRTSVMMVPGEGEESCIDVIDRQNKGRGIIMGPSMCKALQERFRHSCLD